MIVSMSKIHLVMRQEDQLKALEALRDLGVVHVEKTNLERSEQLNYYIEHLDRLEHVISVLKDQAQTMDKTNKAAQAFSSHGALREAVEAVLIEVDNIEGLKEDIQRRRDVIQKWEAWGDFDPHTVEVLKTKGIFCKLVLLSSKEFESFASSDNVIVSEINRSASQVRCLVISREEIDVPGEEVALPETSLQNMKKLSDSEKAMLGELETKLNSFVPYLQEFEKEKVSLENSLHLQEVVESLDSQSSLNVLKGFCPKELESQFKEAAKKNKWGYLIEEPTEEDQVPTLLKNPSWVSLSKPAFQLIEILPGYKEVDVSAVFMIFFTLFFAMLIGDAAYGAIFFIGTLAAQLTIGKKMKDKTPFFLMYVLTGGTIIWGVLTGVYFGNAWLPSSVGPIVPWLDNAQNVQWLCFTIALVHLCLARFWTFKNKLPCLTAFAELGWAAIIIGMYFLANQFVLGNPFPAFAKWFFVFGIPVALIFMVPFKNFVKEVPQNFIPFILSVIGAGTDIISYIRLFAVGLATVAVADAANQMPAALPGIGYFFMIFLHLLNMVLAAMAILVHAIRLNVLEFSGHLGLEWSGFKYNPFKKEELAAAK